MSDSNFLLLTNTCQESDLSTVGIVLICFICLGVLWDMSK
jgi:hypothetical protein